MTHQIQAAGPGAVSSSPKTGDPSKIIDCCAQSMNAFAPTFGSLAAVAGPALAHVLAATVSGNGGNARG